MGKGAGPPVVFLPGLQGDSAIFADLVDVLGNHVSAWGFSFGDRGLLEDCADLSYELSRNALVAPRLICGSYGGQVALRTQEGVHSIVVTGSFPSWASLLFRQRRTLNLANQMPMKSFDWLYRKRFVSRLERDGVPLDLARGMGTPDGKAIRQRLRSLKGLKAAVSSCPLLWLSGEEDGESPWLEKDIHKAWPEAEYRRLPGKHRPYASHAADFAACVRDWWSLIDTSDEDARGV